MAWDYICQDAEGGLSETALLSIRNLRMYYHTDEGVVRAVDGVNLEIHEGEVVGLVGESGCGKSTLAHSILRLTSGCKSHEGEVIFHETDLLKISDKEMQNIRGNKISMIFQNPSSSLNPVLTVGWQVEEAIITHKKLQKPEVKKRLLELFHEVEIPESERRLKSYPHEFSGGMRQRVMIAMALACSPELLIADEPTTNLDVTVQGQILNLFRNLRRDFQSAILFITHNLGVVCELADKVALMYAGELVEYADVAEFFENPIHPYARALLRAIPRHDRKIERLYEIRGKVPSLIDPPQGCKFQPRCPHATQECIKGKPEVKWISSSHQVACLNAK